MNGEFRSGYTFRPFQHASLANDDVTWGIDGRLAPRTLARNFDSEAADDYSTFLYHGKWFLRAGVVSALFHYCKQRRPIWF